jgi:peptidoglycan/LPS O-acetylase OafA/YrhL
MRRVEELDSIRGLAALAIVVFHLYLFPYSMLGTSIYLFFVLSGYLITSILLSHPPSGEFLYAFYARRGLRIWPIYYLSLLLVVLINPWTPNPAGLESLPQYLTFTQLTSDYWSDAPPVLIPAFGHTWSLAVEEQFYIIFPALLVLFRRRGVWLAAMAMVALAMAMRALGYSRWILGTNCDGLALGAVLAGLLHGRSQSVARELYATRFSIVGLGAAAYWIAGAILLHTFPDGRSGMIGPTMAATRPLALNLAFFALVGLVVIYAGDRKLAALRDRRLVYLGTISYGFYLYHYIIYHFFDEYALRAGLGRGIAFDLGKLAASFLVAALSYRFVERPLLSMKDRFPYPAAGGAEVGFPRGLVPLAGPQEG